MRGVCEERTVCRVGFSLRENSTLEAWRFCDIKLCNYE